MGLESMMKIQNYTHYKKKTTRNTTTNKYLEEAKVQEGPERRGYLQSDEEKAGIINES